jgi:hypothetical protein
MTASHRSRYAVARLVSSRNSVAAVEASVTNCTLTARYTDALRESKASDAFVRMSFPRSGAARRSCRGLLIPWLEVRILPPEQ